MEGDSLTTLQWCCRCCSFSSRLKFIMQKWKTISFCFFCQNAFFVSVGLKSDRSGMYPGGGFLTWPGYSSITQRCEPSVPENTLSYEHNASPSCLSRSVGSYPAQLLETPSLICPSCYWIRLHTHTHTHTQ